MKFAVNELYLFVMRLKIIVFFFILTAKTFAQNLVPNPGFENYSNCPTTAGQIYYSRYWYQPAKMFGMNVNISSTSDYFNQCATLSSNVSIPFNTGGYQPARTGNAYAGIGCFVMGMDYREYLATSLTTSLVSGKRYCISFYVNLSDSSKYAIGSLGAYLSLDSSLYVVNTFYNHLPVVPQIENNPNSYLTDTSRWVLVSGNYIAQGGEKFILIGNFRDSVSTPYQIVNASQNNTFAYYYIEDVSVTCCDADNCVDTPLRNDIFIPTAFSPNDDGNNDILFVRSNAPVKDMDFSVYDRWGELVFHTNDIAQGWDGTYNGNKLSNGIFVYYCKGIINGKEFFQKGDIALIR